MVILSLLLSSSACSAPSERISFVGDRDFQLRDTTFRDLSYPGSGGAIFISSPTEQLLISQVNFLNCRAEGRLSDGGACFLQSSHSTLLSCSFADCFATRSGQALQLSGIGAGAESTFSDGTFLRLGRSGDRYGHSSGLFLAFPFSSISNSNFTSSACEASGGSLYLPPSTRTVIKSLQIQTTFESDSSVCSDSSDPHSLQFSKFSNNSCRKGAAEVLRSGLWMQNCAFLRNSGDRDLWLAPRASPYRLCQCHFTGPAPPPEVAFSDCALPVLLEVGSLAPGDFDSLASGLFEATSTFGGSRTFKPSGIFNQSETFGPASASTSTGSSGGSSGIRTATLLLPQSENPSAVSAGVVAAAVVGGCVFIGLIVAGVLLYRRATRPSELGSSSSSGSSDEEKELVAEVENDGKEDLLLD